ncbi:MAG: hypothetical protein AAF202_08150 [Pseudomonadota bacterium]
MTRILCALLLSLMTPLTLQAEEKDKLNVLDYPELHVTPSASARLERLANKEKSDRLKNHSAMFLSSIATLVASFQATDSPQVSDDPDNVDQNELSSQVGLAVGGGWLLTNLLLATTYNPYQSGYKEIKKMKSDTQRNRLARERFAEEALYKPAKLGNRLLWFSVITNLAASAFIMGYGDEDAKLAGGISAAVALGPIFFPYQWIDSANQHRLYKKKIYGPVASVALLNDGSEDRNPLAGVGFNYSF